MVNKKLIVFSWSMYDFANTIFSMNIIRRIKAEGIHPLKRLIYLNKEEFDLLKVLRVCFLKRALSFFKQPPEPRFVTEEKPFKCPTTHDLDQGDGKISPSYESTNIHHTRDSLFWAWRRVKEYCRDLLDMDDKSAMREAYQLMRG